MLLLRRGLLINFNCKAREHRGATNEGTAGKRADKYVGGKKDDTLLSNAATKISRFPAQELRSFVKFNLTSGHRGTGAYYFLLSVLAFFLAKPRKIQRKKAR